MATKTTARRPGRRRKRRAYSSPVRRQQQDLTRQRIMEACLGLIVEGRLADFGMQDIANRAGVSAASVYRHFPSREAILNGLYTWAEDELIKWGGEPPRRLADLSHATRRLLAKFEDHFEIVTAFAIALIALRVEPEYRRRRDELIRRMVAEAAPRLESGQLAEAAALISHITSVLTWVMLRTRFGLSAEQAANAILTTLDMLIASATGKAASA